MSNGRSSAEPLPAGISGTCFLGLGMLAGQQGTTTQIRLLLAAEGETLTQSQIRTSLHNLAHPHRKQPLVILTHRGSGRKFGDPGRWELTEHGRMVLADGDEATDSLKRAAEQKGWRIT